MTSRNNVINILKYDNNESSGLVQNQTSGLGRKTPVSSSGSVLLTFSCRSTMYGPHHHHESPPVRSATSQHTSYHFTPYSCGSADEDQQPQLFYRCLSPPGLVRTFKGVTVLLCFLILALVASTLVWEINANGYGGSISGGGFVETSYAGYYAGTYGYSSSYMTPMSAKAAMMAVSAINFIVSLALLVWSFSRTRISRGCRFYLTVFISDIILAMVQVILTPLLPLNISGFSCGCCL